MSLKIAYFKNLLIQTSRGNKHGRPANAKPLYLLALIHAIEEGVLIGNNIKYDKRIESIYLDMCKQFEPDIVVTPFYKPFFHMKRESYYMIKWKHGVEPPHLAHTPSAKFLRENVEFAAFDDELWDLLQIPETREELKSTIIKFFLS